VGGRELIFPSNILDERRPDPAREVGDGDRGHLDERRFRLCHQMTRLLLAIVGLGLLASVSPSTLIAFVALLASGKPKRNGVGFLVGWNVSLIVVFTLCYGAGKTRISTLHTDGHAVSCIVEVALGVVFVGLAARAWWRRNHQEKLWQASNKLSADLAHLRPWQAAVLGVIEQPWTLTALAAVVVVSHKSGPLAVVLAFVLFSALSTAGVITMFVYSTVRSDVAENRLDDVKRRLVQIGPIAAAVLSALVGAALIAVGSFGLVTN
jgi:threonine/homoserine/homoserine lactone efflux protein